MHSKHVNQNRVAHGSQEGRGVTLKKTWKNHQDGATRKVPYSTFTVYWQRVLQIYDFTRDNENKTYRKAIVRLTYPQKAVFYPEAFEYMEDDCPLWTFSD
jgi:hypothetical protein